MLSLDSSWLFLRQDVAGASAAGFNDSAWTAVTLPHTWNNLDGQDGGNDYYRGTGWYRKYYTVPTNLAGQELFLKFDGANYTTDLYVNGAFVGEHQGGFAAFSWDITPYVTVGATNVFAVKVNNVFNAVAVPLSGDITWDGGLYRHVNLIATDPLHISLTDYASPGVYLQQTNVSSYSANVQVTTKLRNDGTTPRQATVLANILDATGNLVQTLTSYVTISPATGMDVLQNTTMYFPHLWNGRSDPYMYQVAVQVIDGTSGKAVDEVDQPLGLRYFSVDPNQGFYLNGQSLDLHGVGFHQDRLNEGWAISDADQIQDVSLIQDIGATFVRLTLYQHPALTYSLLDQDGIIAWSDLPLINTVVASPAFIGNAKQQLMEMMLQNYNHPSVLFWGIYDELSDNGTAESYVQQLVQLAHQVDPSRLTADATNLADNKPINFLTDVTGFNKYFGWYYGSANDFGPWADNIHSTYPNVPIGISEYGAGASIYQHQSNAYYPQYPAYTWHPEEYQDTFHEVYWKQLASRPYLWVKSVWDMFDFAVDSRNEGDTPGRNDKGLVSYDRKTLKDSFYWYKANWSTSPVLYLTSRSYINRPTNLVDLKVYSNLSAVQLSINGVVIGTTTSTDHIFRWSAVQLTPGANAIEVTAKRNGTTFTDDVTWYAPMQLAGVPFARIKFQPIGLPVAAGYLPDYGYIYGDRGNGFTYGWDSDNSANTFARGVMSDPRYDSGIAMEQPTGGHAWQIAVPNGTYAIHLVSGDPSNFDSIDEIAVQGVLAVSGGVNVLSRYQEAWRTVTVANGLLTITNATGSSNDKLDFVEINRTDGGVQVATATHFALTASTSATAGGPIGVTVIALNASGGVAAGYTGTVHFTSSDGQALLPADYTFGNADAGIHTFPNAIILKTAGSGSLTVQDAISNSISGNALVSVAPAAASHFSVRTALSSMAGHAFSGTVAALDPYGNTAISYTGTVHFTSSDGQATLPTDYTFVGGDAGTHTFTNTFILKTAGVQTITASDNLHGSMTGTAMLGVSAAAAALYTVTAPASSAAGNALGITVRAVDAFGNTAANYTGTVHFSSSDIQAVLPADYTFMKSDAGMHSFGNAVTFKTSGGQSLTVLDTATVSISGSIQNIAVSAAPASHLLASVSGSTTAGTPFDLTVKAVDSYGNLDTRYQGTVQFTTSDATGGQLPANYTFTSSDTGIHTFAAAAALFTAGSQTVTAADAASGIAGSTTVALAPAPANHFALTVLAEVAAKVPFDATVTALDPYGNTDINYQGTVHFMTSDTDPGVVLPADYAFAASDRGVHLFGGGIVLMTAGKQTVTATDMTNGALLQSVSITVDPGTMPPPPGMAGGREGLSSTPVLDPAMVIGSTPASQQATPTDRLFASPENWGSGRQTGVSALWLERGQRVPHSLADSSSLVVEEQGEDLIHSALIGRDSSGPARFV